MQPIAAMTRAVPMKLTSMTESARTRDRAISTLLVTEVRARRRGRRFWLLSGNRQLAFADHLQRLRVVQVEACVLDLFLEFRLIEHLCQRCRISAAVLSSVLDENRHHDLRTPQCCVRDKPCVVALHERQSCSAEPTTLGNDLCRAGLAADVQSGDARVAGGAPFLIDHFPEALSHGFKCAGRELEFANDLA